MVRVWDLRTRSLNAKILLDQPGGIAVTPTGDLVIGFHNDVALFRRKPHAT